MSNDAYIEDDERPDDGEMMAEYIEWNEQQQALPAHKRDGWRESMFDHIDDKRKERLEACPF